MNARLDLPVQQVPQGGVVDGAILFEGSDESGGTSAELHVNKITRMRGEAKSQLETWRSASLQLPPHILEIVKTLLAGNPFGGADGPLGEGATGGGVVTKINRIMH